jgi:F0F1-type ATP synthase assembly protein I
MAGFDLSAKRELNKGFGDALAVAVELAVTPAIFALLGWWLDSWLDTTPIFLIAFFTFTMGYVAWKQYVLYTARMEQERDALFAPKSETTEP